MTLKFNWKRIQVRQFGLRVPRFKEPTLILHKTQVTFNEKATEEVLEEIHAKFGEKLYATIDYDEHLHALGFIFTKSKLPNSITFNVATKGARHYRLSSRPLYRSIDLWKRVGELGRNYFPLLKTESQDPQNEGSTIFAVLIQ